MRTDDPRGRLIGRDEDIRTFADLVREVNLVVLSGESGVGKSSLLQAGILPELRDAGFLVLSCADWSAEAGRIGEPEAESNGSEATEKFLAKKLAASLPDDIPVKAGFLSELNDAYGDGAIIVLDQFEELIRHKPALYDKVREWIQHAVDEYDVRIVISLREEFKHRLRDLVVGPFKRADFYLHPLHARGLVKQVIEAGRRSDGSGGVIKEEATRLLLDLWEQAGGGRPWSGIGLLHLQALLYVLWSDACGDLLKEPEPDLSGVILEVDQVLEAMGWAQVSAPETAEPHEYGEAAQADALFRAALARAVSYRLAACRDVYLRVQTSADRVLTDGVVTIIARMADHLASGGYKVDQEEGHLAQLVLDEELATLGFAGGLTRNDLAARTFSTLAKQVAADDGEWLTARRKELIGGKRAEENLLASLQSKEGIGGSAGPMMGFSRVAVLLEELRRYFFALEWLVASDLVRRTSPEDGTTMVALVHDGFGRGLSEWAYAHAEDAGPATSRLTATVGKKLTWDPSAHPGEPDPFDGTKNELGIRYVNLRWRSSQIAKVSFKKVVLINCDFRGTSFDYCTFEGTTFVNCLLDGADFSHCTVIGDVSAIPMVRGGDRPLPSFRVIGPELARVLDHYCETDLEETPAYGSGEAPEERYIISWTAGLPASPASSELIQKLMNGDVPRFQYQSWEPQSSGLMVCGGRLSSLMFSDCHGPTGDSGADGPMGTVALRHVAGTSLEFGEQRAGKVQLVDVAIRGLTISPPVWLSEAEAESGKREKRPEVGDFELVVFASVLQDVWFSTPLAGTARIGDSLVWQLFNANAQSGFDVTFDHGFDVPIDKGTAHLGVVNCPPTGFAQDADGFVAINQRRDDVDQFAAKVDYQSLGSLLAYLPDPPEDLRQASEE
jgi:hypothetical protein